MTYVQPLNLSMEFQKNHYKKICTPSLYFIFSERSEEVLVAKRAMKYPGFLTLLCVAQYTYTSQETAGTHYDNAAVATDVPQCSEMGK